jgi:hypothetical protein
LFSSCSHCREEVVVIVAGDPSKVFKLLNGFQLFVSDLEPCCSCAGLFSVSCLRSFRIFPVLRVFVLLGSTVIPEHLQQFRHLELAFFLDDDFVIKMSVHENAAFRTGPDVLLTLWALARAACPSILIVCKLLLTSSDRLRQLLLVARRRRR